eukprot:jgi/Hompol1/3254/HPOL_003178-RA
MTQLLVGMRRAAAVATAAPSLLRPTLAPASLYAFNQQRSIYSLPKRIPPVMSKFEVDVKVLELVHDYANVPEDKINMNSSFIHDLLIDFHERYGFYTELVDTFMLDVRSTTRFTRDLKSAREAADWAAALMEQEGRLKS